VLHLGMGEKASQIKPEHPTQQYTEFFKEQLRVVCAALGIPLSCVLYFFDRSYSASRAELAVMGRQHDPIRWVIESRLLRPVYRFWVAGEIRNGRVAKVAGWDRCAWTWPALPVLDPKIEVEARANQLSAGLITREAALRSLGVEMEVEEFYRQRGAELSFTVPSSDRERAIEVAGKIAKARGALVADVPHVAKLSITGVGIRSHAGVADRLFAPLGEAGINVDLVSTSEVRLNVVVAAEQGKQSLDVLRKAFGL
jgi:hypothetical protein